MPEGVHRRFGSVLPGCLVLSALLAEPCLAQQTRLNIDEAVAKALSQHAALRAADARIAGSEGLRQQATFRPNPTASLQTENWRAWGNPSFTPGADLDVFAYVLQPFETGGKREKRTTIAAKDVALVQVEKEVIEWRIRQEVRQAFLRAFLAQRQLEIMRENGGYFDQIVEYHRVRVAEGAMAEADLLKVRLERERLTLHESTAAAEAERTKVDLFRAMGSSDFPVSGSLADVAAHAPAGPPLSSSALLQLARDRRPEMRLAAATSERARAELDLQVAQAKPDWTVSFGYKRNSGFDTLLAGVSVPLPFFNRNQGNIAFGTAEINRSENLKEMTRRQIEGEVASALAGLRRRHDMVAQLDRGMLERAEESWRISLAAYREGGTDLLRLLDAQRVLSEVRLLEMRTRLEYLISLAEVEAAVGQENLNLLEEILRVP
jgi:outer membrane protein, heavy metal efflux system